MELIKTNQQNVKKFNLFLILVQQTSFKRHQEAAVIMNDITVSIRSVLSSYTLSFYNVT